MDKPALGSQTDLDASPLQKSIEYCNKPEPNKIIEGTEGLHSASTMKFIGAALLIRHGDRLPISRPTVVADHTVHRNSCHLDYSAHPTTRLLHSYIKTIDENAKNIKQFLSPHLAHFDLLPDTCSDISVTQTGIVQMLEIGRYLGRRYFDKLERKPKITLSTSRFARTYQSLLSFMYGFAEDRFLEILSDGIDSSSSIYFCDGDQPNSPSYATRCDCSNNVNIPKLRLSFRYWDLKKPSLSYLYQILKIGSMECLQNSCTNDNTERQKSVISPSRVWDWLVSDYYCPGLELPCFPRKGQSSSCLNSSIIADLVQLVEQNQRDMISNSEYIKGASLAMYPLLTSINRKFLELWAGYQEEDETLHPYLWIMSSHDVTVGPLFTALGRSSLQKVPYATRLIFELWANGTRNSPSFKPYIRLLLNGKDITSEISICRQCEISDGEHCPLRCFDKFLNDMFLRKFGHLAYESACQSYSS